MEKVLPDGKVKVKGVVVNEVWRQKHEEAKKRVQERRNDPKFMAKLEEHKRKKEKEHIEQGIISDPEKDKAILEERVRKKMMAEAMEQMGWTEEWLSQQRADIAEKQAQNHYMKENKSETETYNQKKAIADASKNDILARERENKFNNKINTINNTMTTIRNYIDIAAIFGGTAGILGGVVAKLVMAGISVSLNIISHISVAKSYKRNKVAIENNLADLAEKNDEQIKAFKNIEKQLTVIANEMKKDEETMIQKYKTMKKGKSNG